MKSTLKNISETSRLLVVFLKPRSYNWCWHHVWPWSHEWPWCWRCMLVTRSMAGRVLPSVCQL